MRLEESVAIAQPNTVVWAFLTDTFNAPRIRGGGVLGLRLTSPGPPGIGSTLKENRVVLGFETKFDHKIIEWDPPHVLTTSIAGPLVRSWIQRLTLEGASDQTRLGYSSEIEPQPLARLLLLFLGPLFRRQAHSAIQDLKRLIEVEKPEGS
jgi:hypothetical protein